MGFAAVVLGTAVGRWLAEPTIAHSTPTVQTVQAAAIANMRANRTDEPASISEPAEATDKGGDRPDRNFESGR